MEILQEVYDKLVKIKESTFPNESSAFLFKDNTVVVKANPHSNSIAHFSDIDPLWVDEQISKHGKPSSLFHSHPCEAYPSYTDLRYMFTTIPFWGCVWLIMSDRNKLRAWTLSLGRSEFTGEKLKYPQRGETIRAEEIEVVIV